MHSHVCFVPQCVCRNLIQGIMKVQNALPYHMGDFQAFISTKMQRSCIFTQVPGWLFFLLAVHLWPCWPHKVFCPSYNSPHFCESKHSTGTNHRPSDEGNHEECYKTAVAYLKLGVTCHSTQICCQCYLFMSTTLFSFIIHFKVKYLYKIKKCDYNNWKVY